MSWFSKYFSRPASITADATVAVACGVVAFIGIGVFKGALLGLGDPIQAAGAGVVGAMVYMRARENLVDTAPAGFLRPG